MKSRYQLCYLPFLTALMFVMAGCSTFGYGNVKIDTTRKAILATNAEVNGMNLLLQDLLQRKAISPADADKAYKSLTQSQEYLQLALTLVDINQDPFAAENRLDAANASLSIVIALLSAYTGEPSP